MKLSFVIISFFIASLITQGNENKYDDYVKELSRLDSNIALMQNVDSAIFYSKIFLSLAININENKYLKSGHYKLSTFYRNKGDFKQSKSHLKEFIKIASKEKNIDDLISGVNMLGIIYKNLNQRGKALEMFFEGIDLLERQENMNTHILSMFYNNIAVVYAEQKKYKECKIFLLKSKKLNDPEQNLALLYNNLGDTEMNLNNFNQAEKHLQEAISRIDSNNVSLFLVIQYSFAELYMKMNKNQKALQYAYDYTAMASINGFTEDVNYGKELIDSILNKLNLLNEIQMADVNQKNNINDNNVIVQETSTNYVRNILDVILIALIIVFGYKLITYKRH